MGGAGQGAQEPFKNKWFIWTGPDRRAAALLGVAIARYDSFSRLASHPARTAQM